MSGAPLVGLRETQPGERPERMPGDALSRAPDRTVFIGGAIVVFFLLLALLPGRSAMVAHLDDAAVLLDEGTRILAGLVPFRDFGAVHGPLEGGLVALGLFVAEDAGAALGLATAFLLVLSGPAFGRIALSRLPPVPGLVVLGLAAALVAGPVNPGESLTALSLAGFAERAGWACTAVLALMILPPRDGCRMRDFAAAATLATVLCLLDAAFGLLGLALLLAAATEREVRAASLGAVAAALAAVALLGAATGFGVDYARHAARMLRLAATPGPLGIEIDRLLSNLADYVLFGLVGGLALLRAGGGGRAIHLLVCAVGGFLVFRLGQQPWGILTLHGGAVAAAETLRRTGAGGRPGLAAGAPLVALAMTLPVAVHFGAAAVLHAAVASDAPAADLGLLRIEGLAVPDLRLADAGEVRRTAARAAEAARFLQRADINGPVMLLDRGNLFSIGFGMPPARGDHADIRPGPLPPVAFRKPTDAAVILEPKAGVEEPVRPATLLLRDLYGPEIRTQFILIGETEHWRIYARRVPERPDGSPR